MFWIVFGLFPLYLFEVFRDRLDLFDRDLGIGFVLVCLETYFFSPEGVAKLLGNARQRAARKDNSEDVEALVPPLVAHSEEDARAHVRGDLRHRRTSEKEERGVTQRAQLVACAVVERHDEGSEDVAQVADHGVVHVRVVDDDGDDDTAVVDEYQAHSVVHTKRDLTPHVRRKGEKHRPCDTRSRPSKNDARTQYKKADKGWRGREASLSLPLSLSWDAYPIEREKRERVPKRGGETKQCFTTSVACCTWTTHPCTPV